MKLLPTLLVSLVASASALAQTPAPSTAPAPPVKAGAKAPAKSPGKKAVAAPAPVNDLPNVTLDEAALMVARQVHLGEIPCELGATVTLRAGAREGLFTLATRGQQYLMYPVESRTGAIRLEDPRRGAVWIQLGNKSMLMDGQRGQRLADECQSPQQVAVAQELKNNPRPGLLDPLPVPVTVPVPALVTQVPLEPAVQPPAASQPQEQLQPQPQLQEQPLLLPPMSPPQPQPTS